MLIRPPVVREMRHDLWVKMTAKPSAATTAVSVPGQSEHSEAESRLANLKMLGELRASGVLTDEEFDLEKSRILG